jgi:succinoglycan biosynthesis protein ExoM
VASQQPSVLIGLLTFRRVNMLQRCLDGLSALTPPPVVAIRLLMVDNDPLGSAVTVLVQRRDRFPFPVDYEIEPMRGITYGRNRVVERAIALDATYVAFLDDDEVPRPDWIANLVRIIEAQDVVAVAGAVDRIYPEVPIPWVLDHRRVVAPRPEGERVREPSTANVIFRTAIARDWGLRFDHRFAICGGSDADFFARSWERGGRHAWTNTAVVDEYVPASRLTWKAIVQRRMSYASQKVIRCRIRRGRVTMLRKFGLKPFAQAGRGMGFLVLYAVTRNRDHAVRAASALIQSAGYAGGLVNRTHQRYAVIQGD